MLRTMVFLAMLGLTCAAVFRGLVPMKPKELAHKEGCYIAHLRDVIPYGASVTGPGCMKLSCTISMIDYATCGTVSTDIPNCYITKGDHSKLYPDCCPTIECDRDNFIEPQDNKL